MLFVPWLGMIAPLSRCPVLYSVFLANLQSSAEYPHSIVDSWARVATQNHRQNKLELGLPAEMYCP